MGLALLPALLGVAVPARADKVLVYQRQNMESQGADEGGPNVADILEALGHSVTRVISLTATLPADLSVFDSVWVIQVTAPTGPEETRLVEFVQAGGGLYLTGENHTCCSAVEASIQNLVTRLTPDVPNIANAGVIGESWVAGTDTWGITSTPNAIPKWLVAAPGSMSQIPLRNQVYQDAAGDKTGMAAWAGEYLTHGGGCLFVSMDLSFWLDALHPEIDKTPFAENVQHFLGTCADSDHDGLTDLGEAEAGTDPESPDSDADGLCDGYRSVTGVCIAGESVFDDTDGDELADPLDPDDDNDTLPTSFEVDAELANPKADNDKLPAWLDVDSDNNNILDSVEGFTDHDGDGIPSITDLGDDPENCDEDADCSVQPGSLGCDEDAGFCQFLRLAPSGEGGAGNAPTAGAAATDGGSSSTGGHSSARAGADNGNDGGDASGNDGDAGNSGGGDTTSASRSSSDSSGCGCSVVGRASNSLAAFTLLALTSLFWRRRRR